MSIVIFMLCTLMGFHKFLELLPFLQIKLSKINLCSNFEKDKFAKFNMNWFLLSLLLSYRQISLLSIRRMKSYVFSKLKSRQFAKNKSIIKYLKTVDFLYWILSKSSFFGFARLNPAKINFIKVFCCVNCFIGYWSIIDPMLV